MKEVKQYVQKIEEVSKYIAFDGREFDTHYECAMWERIHYRQMLKDSSDDIEKLDATIPPITMDAANFQNSNFDWYKVHTEKGLEILKGTFGLEKSEMPEVGEIVCIETTDTNSCYCTRLVNIVREFIRFLDCVEHGYVRVISYALDDFIFNEECGGSTEDEEDIAIARKINELLYGNIEYM